jgi:hypothetical protein
MTVEDAAGSLSLALRVSQPLVLQARHSQCSQCEPPRMSAEPAVCLQSAELLPVQQTTERSWTSLCRRFASAALHQSSCACLLHDATCLTPVPL